MNIGNPDEFTVLELAEIVLEITGSLLGDRARAAAGRRPDQRRPDITLARPRSAGSPRSGLREGLRRTIPHFRTIPAEVAAAASSVGGDQLAGTRAAATTLLADTA